MMPVASCIPFPLFVPCDDMLAMLVCATHWLSMHLYTLAYMFMHESYLLVCHPCFNTMKLWTFNPNLHLFLPDITFCLLSCLFAFLLVFLLAYFLAFLFLCMPCLLRLSTLCHFHMLLASFPSIACPMVSRLCLCIYTHRAKTHGVRARSPRHKQKGHECKHVDMSQMAMFSRFRGLPSPFWVMYSLNPPFLPFTFLS